MDQVLCRLCAPSGAGIYQREIRQFVWSHRSEKETDLVIISGNTSIKVHQAVILPLSSHLTELLPPTCPCTKPAIYLPPFSSHVLTAAFEILYNGTTTRAASEEDLVQVKEVFSLLKIKADVYRDMNVEATKKKIFQVEDLEAMFTSFKDSHTEKRTKKVSSESELNEKGEFGIRTVTGGVILKIEPNDPLEFTPNEHHRAPNEQQITTNETFGIPEYEQQIIPPQSCYLNEVTGVFYNDGRGTGLDEANSCKNHDEVLSASSSFKSIQSQGHMASAMILDEATGVFCYDERQKLSGLLESENSKINNPDYKSENKSLEDHEHEIMKCSNQAKKKDLTRLRGEEEQSPTSKLAAKKKKAKESDEVLSSVLKSQSGNKKLKGTGLDGSILSSTKKTYPRDRKLGIKLTCSKCDYTTTRKDNLNRHCDRMHLKVLYNCKQCDYKTSCGQTLKRHIEVVHEKILETKLACSKCDFTTKRKDNLNRHFDSVHKRIFYNCNQCDFKTAWKIALTRHIEAMHEKKLKTKLACSKCAYTTERKDNLNSHFNRMHKKIMYNCNQCDYTTTWRENLTKHNEALHENNSYSCDKCDFVSTSKLIVKKHIELVHQDINFHYNCSKCMFTTTHKQNLKNHIDVVHLKISQNCDQCDFTSKYKRALKKHIQVAHQKLGFNCTQCEFKTMWKNSLKYHIKGMHAGVLHSDYQHNPKDLHKPSLSSRKSVDGEVTTNCRTRAQNTEQKRVQKKS